MPKLQKSESVRHIIPISGKDSLCAAIVQMARDDSLPYEFMFCDVGSELPETYDWLNSVEKKLGIKINRIGKSLEGVIAEVGKLPGFHYRFCTRNAKIYPMHEYIGKDQAVQYVGFRADEKDRIPPSGTERANIKEKYPLIEMGVNLPLVFKILSDRDVMPPTFYWHRLYKAVYEAVGPASRKFMETCAPWTKNYLFSWRSRSNCYFCFYQRLYEWVGLLEHHPNLFDRAEEIERVYGSYTSEYRIEKHEKVEANQDYRWHQGWPLSKIREEADRIFKRRVSSVCDLLVDTRHKAPEEIDLLSMTSCGAYCGK